MSLHRSEIRRLIAAGRSPNEIARQMGIAANTVRYHAARADSESESSPTVDRRPHAAPPPRQVKTREEVSRLLRAGCPRAEIASRLGISKGTVSYHARRLGEVVDEKCARRYDWSEVQRYYDLGHSVRQCQAVFGFSGASWHSAVRRGAVKARPTALPLEELLVANTYRGRHNLKARIIKAGLKEARCEICGLTDWRGRPISLALHHLNGDGADNRLVNLQVLCPNCHSQTPNFSGRNARLRMRARAFQRLGAVPHRPVALPVIGVAA